MKTTQLYLTDSYRTQMEATVLETIREDDNRYRVLLDQTVFYAMGGGQPTDQGVLQFGDQAVTVFQVSMKDGQLWHYYNGAHELRSGDSVHGKINWDRRFKNMRVHSAGHVIDFALHLLGYTPAPLHPFKGDHGKKPWILYQGILDRDITEELQNRVDELIRQDASLTTDFVSYDELLKSALYIQPNLPKNKPLRALTLEGVGTVADGGTQVRSTSEIGPVRVISIESDEDVTRIQYRLK